MVEWNDYTTLSDFRNLRAGQFDPVRETFGIGLSEEQLTACAVHCALVLRRDPTVGELRLWDRLAKVSAPLSETTVFSMETESAAIAETYADMMAKRRELSLSTEPVTLAEMLNLASDALARGGKARALKGTTLRLQNLLAAPFAKTGVSEEKSAAFLSVSASTDPLASLESGDLCLLIDRGALTKYDYAEKLFSVLESDELQNALRGQFPVSEAGLLPTLLSRFDGFTVDLSRLGTAPNPSPEILAEAFADAWILVAAKQTAKEIVNRLRDAGLSCRIFAELISEKQVRILGERQLAESTDFLRSFLLRPSVPAVTLQATAKAAPISHKPRAGYDCRFFQGTPATANALAIPDLSASAASAKLSERAFSTAVLTSLAPILSCALAGVDYSDLRLAIDLTVPKAGFDPAPAYAAAVGLYRVQAELGIPAVKADIRESKVKAPVLSVFALGKGLQPPAEKLAQADSRIYLLPVPLSPEGLPDFGELRVLLADLAAQAEHGVIRSARVVLQKSPKKALAEMQSETLRAQPKEGAKGLGRPLALGILLETNYEMPFEWIADVAEMPQPESQAKKATAEDDRFRIPAGNGLIWRKAPEVVILAPKDSPDALALAKFLRAAGNEVKVFGNSEKELFLRAVLTASIVYRMPGTVLPRGAKAGFAYTVLRRNGGQIRDLQRIAR